MCYYLISYKYINFFNEDMKKYKRILLKLSGEVFGGRKEEKGISFSATEKIAKNIAEIKRKYRGDLAMVVGAGNIFRGRSCLKRDIKKYGCFG